MTDRPNPAQLAPYDPAWPTVAERLLTDLRAAIAAIPGAATARYDHIGSTSVPGLAAKPFLDLQVRIFPLPDYDTLDAALEPLGFRRAQGSRPDSPGVTRDTPPPYVVVSVDDTVWEKRLYVHAGKSVILHIRRPDSPWGCQTVWFRDWLRTHSDDRLRYEATKRALAEQNIGKPDYDDYTRAKSVFFREMRPAFDWAQARG